ncbi:MAG: hypothetical protein GEU87_18540 [Alphaproteobacteria bacterium]|nr:hypothetical protein [Alphaproteobacteria bacterium]
MLFLPPNSPADRRHALPPLVDAVGWGYAFAFLAIGPAAGVAAMARLRAHPDAAKLAGGRR